MTITSLVKDARLGNEDAFAEIVKRHQNLVLGYAFNRLGDFQRAQDVVQETFILAWARLDSLNESASFPSWLRGIALNCCRRSMRKHRGDWISLDQHLELATEDETQDALVQRGEERASVQSAVAGLPARLRDVTTLYYLEENSQRDVAEFLGIAISKVNNDLHASRQLLKGRLGDMAKREISKERLNSAFAERLGQIIRVEGPFVEADIGDGDMPGLLDVVGTGDEENGSKLLVIQRLGDGRYRALKTEGKPGRGDKLTRQGDPFATSHSVTDELIRDAVNRQKGKATARLLETGIKVVDLMAPVMDGNTLGIIGGAGVGRAVFLEELIERREAIAGKLGTFFFLTGWDAMGMQGMPHEGEYASDIHENLENTFLLYNGGRDPAFARDADYLDVRIFFSPILAMRGYWPSIDPLHCYSVNRSSSALDPRHAELAESARTTLQNAHDLLADAHFYELVALGARQEAMRHYQTRRDEGLTSLSEAERLSIHRADRLQAFFTQPFLISEEFSGTAGEVVTLAQTLDGIEAILRGDHDGKDASKLMMRGAI